MRFLLSYIVVLYTLLLAAQVPNGDFENWEVRDHFKLNNYYSPTRNVQRSSDAKEGKYSLKLSNTYIENSTGYRGYAYNIDKPNGVNGFAYSGDALSLVFYSKHELAIGDTARVYAIFRDKGVYKGKVDFRFTGSSNGDWIKYSVPIEWNGSRLTDSVWLYFYSYADAAVDGDGFVLFDDVHFTKLNQRQPDITNFGFEDWENTGLSFPKSWRSLDLLVYDTYVSYLYEPTTTKVTSTEAFRGDASLLVKNAYSNASGSLRYGYCFIGTENNDYYTPCFATDTFKYLQGYYKYLPDGDDTARINYRTWEKGAGKSYDILYLPASSEWKFFTLPINYYSKTAMPDSAALIIYSGKTDSVRGPNSSLYIDELKLVMEPKGVGVHTPNNQIKIYPTPVNSILFVETQSKEDLIIFNYLGIIIDSYNILPGENEINLSAYSPGIYFIKSNKTSSQWIQKIVKQ